MPTYYNPRRKLIGLDEKNEDEDIVPFVNQNQQYIPRVTMSNVNTSPAILYSNPNVYALFSQLVHTPFENLGAIAASNGVAEHILSDELFWVYKLYNDYFVDRDQVDHFVKNIGLINISHNYINFLNAEPYLTVYKILMNDDENGRLTMALVLGSFPLYTKIISTLGANIDQDVWHNILYYAAIGGSVQIFKSLIDMGATGDYLKVISYLIETDNLELFDYVLKLVSLPDSTLKQLYTMALDKDSNNIAESIKSAYPNLFH